jgi:Flp pilus assembly pilin Flp
MSLARTLISDERAATMPEYALLVALIAVTAIAAITFLSDSIVGTFGWAGDALDEQVPASGS